MGVKNHSQHFTDTQTNYFHMNSSSLSMMYIKRLFMLKMKPLLTLRINAHL